MAGEVADPDSNKQLVLAYKLILPHLLSDAAANKVSDSRGVARFYCNS